MQVTCPECSARYVVKPESIGPNGRKVKCARCEHVWKEDPVEVPENSPEAIIAEALSEEIGSGEIPDAMNRNLPVPTEKKPTPAGLKAVAILLMLVALGVSFVGHSPGLKHSTLLAPIYAMFGMGDMTGVQLAEISVATLEKRGKNQFFINGMIFNTTEHTLPLPVLMVSLIDGAGEVVQREEFARKSVELPAGESLPFNTELQTRSGDIAEVVLDIGSSFDIKLRK